MTLCADDPEGVDICELGSTRHPSLGVLNGETYKGDPQTRHPASSSLGVGVAYGTLPLFPFEKDKVVVYGVIYANNRQWRGDPTFGVFPKDRRNKYRQTTVHHPQVIYRLTLYNLLLYKMLVKGRV